MRFKLDENIPATLVADLGAIGHDAQTCSDEGIAGTGDPAIAAHARSEGRCLITCDLDFADVRTYPLGSHPGIVILRLRRPDMISFHAALARLFATIAEVDFAGNLIVVSESKIRIRRSLSTP